jgi:NAD+ synthase (glutamine-hydrolysing)
MASGQRSLTLALAQINTTVGDIAGNSELIREQIARAREAGARLVLTPELAVTGYPPEDLLLKRDFLEANRAALAELADDARDLTALVGFVDGDGPIYNAMAVLADGEIHGVYRKMLLPNYGVFDERRYFEPASSPALLELGGILAGLTICEDCWVAGPPESLEAAAGAVLIVNASASPYHRGKGAERERMFAQRARDNVAAFALCNAVGGQDELVFDGHSVVVDERGETVARAPQFEEHLLVCELELPGTPEQRDQLRPQEAPPADVPVIARIPARSPAGERTVRGPCEVAAPLDPEEREIYAALRVGLRDYVTKNGFERAVLALSGGIDSALVALIATDALGPERVTCVVMPSPHSSDETQEDARRIAENLGVDLVEIPIEPAMEAYADALAGRFDGTDPGLAEENIQARIRGNLVMALSNKFGWLVLTTGNKSELSVGYATLYGDMAGGFAVIKDVPKTLVYRLVRWRVAQQDGELIPESVLERPPSAELRPDQRDEDSLAPYELLDRILEAYVERDESREEIVAGGIPEDVVDEVLRKVDLAEYKRRQAPPGIKISPKAFGRDRRLPITNRYRV